MGVINSVLILLMFLELWWAQLSMEEFHRLVMVSFV